MSQWVPGVTGGSLRYLRGCANWSFLSAHARTRTKYRREIPNAITLLGKFGKNDLGKNVNTRGRKNSNLHTAAYISTDTPGFRWSYRCRYQQHTRHTPTVLFVFRKRGSCASRRSLAIANAGFRRFSRFRALRGGRGSKTVDSRSQLSSGLGSPRGVQLISESFWSRCHGSLRTASGGNFGGIRTASGWISFGNSPSYVAFLVVAAPPITKPQPFSVGVFSCLFTRVRGDPCGSLRTSASGPWPRPGSHSSLSWPFFSPASLSWTRPKSAKAERQMPIIQGVTRGRIKRLNCSFGRGTKLGVIEQPVSTLAPRRPAADPRWWTRVQEQARSS